MVESVVNVDLQLVEMLSGCDLLEDLRQLREARAKRHDAVHRLCNALNISNHLACSHPCLHSSRCIIQDHSDIAAHRESVDNDPL